MDDSDDDIQYVGDFPCTSNGTGLATKKRRRESASEVSEDISIKEEEKNEEEEVKPLWKIVKRYDGDGDMMNKEDEVYDDEGLDELDSDEDIGDVSLVGSAPDGTRSAGDLEEPVSLEPTIIFADGERTATTRTAVKCSLGDIWECNDYKIFACDPDTIMIHDYLRNGTLRELYMNKTVPQGFQGSGTFAVEVSKAVLGDCEVLEISKHDGNRAWKQTTTTNHIVDEDGSDVHLFSQYYIHSKVKGFKKVISFVSLGADSKEIDYDRTDFVIIRYYWSKGFSMKSFDPSEFQLPRIPAYFQKLYEKKFASAKRGKSMAPRHAYVEVLESIPPAVVQFNPSFQPAGVRQAKNVKQKVKRARFGTGGIQYFLDAHHVESRFFKVQKKDAPNELKPKRQVHFLFEEYQLQLLAKYAFGPGNVPVQLDVKFDLTDAFAVVMTLQIPGMQNKKRKTLVTVFAFVAIVETKEEEVYHQCASWLRDKMEALGVVIENNDGIGNLKLITDDEPGLYYPFVKRFRARHALCYVHMKKAFERKMKQAPYCLPDELIRLWMMHIFGQPDRSHGTYQPGVVDEETLNSMKAKLLQFDLVPESKGIEVWLQGPSGVGKLFRKMSPAVRQNIGIFPDLPHTNIVGCFEYLTGPPFFPALRTLGRCSAGSGADL